MSIIRDPEVYERFEQVIVVHGVRTVSGARLLRLHPR
jgi:ferredoxin-NADP reductase